MTDYEINCQFLALKYFDLALPVEADVLRRRYNVVCLTAEMKDPYFDWLRLAVVHDAIASSEFCLRPWRQPEEILVA